MALLLFSSCSIGPPPKMDTGILNMKDRKFEFKNSKGTKFIIYLSTQDPNDVKYLHNQICAPGDQVIDMLTWIRKVMNQLQSDYYTKR